MRDGFDLVLINCIEDRRAAHQSDCLSPFRSGRNQSSITFPLRFKTLMPTCHFLDAGPPYDDRVSSQGKVRLGYTDPCSKILHVEGAVRQIVHPTVELPEEPVNVGPVGVKAGRDPMVEDGMTAVVGHPVGVRGDWSEV